jgi:hypothetical protein
MVQDLGAGSSLTSLALQQPRESIALGFDCSESSPKRRQLRGGGSKGLFERLQTCDFRSRYGRFQRRALQIRRVPGGDITPLRTPA